MSVHYPQPYLQHEVLPVPTDLLSGDDDYMALDPDLNLSPTHSLFSFLSPSPSVSSLPEAFRHTHDDPQTIHDPAPAAHLDFSSGSHVPGPSTPTFHLNIHSDSPCSTCGTPQLHIPITLPTVFTFSFSMAPSTRLASATASAPAAPPAADPVPTKVTRRGTRAASGSKRKTAAVPPAGLDAITEPDAAAQAPPAPAAPETAPTIDLAAAPPSVNPTAAPVAPIDPVTAPVASIDPVTAPVTSINPATAPVDFATVNVNVATVHGADLAATPADLVITPVLDSINLASAPTPVSANVTPIVRLTATASVPVPAATSAVSTGSSARETSPMSADDQIAALRAEVANLKRYKAIVIRDHQRRSEAEVPPELANAAPVSLTRPAGERGKEGWNLQDHLGLTEHGAYYNKLLYDARAATAALDPSVTFSAQNAKYIDMGYEKLRKRHPYLHRFEGSWVYKELCMGVFQNRRKVWLRDHRNSDEAVANTSDGTPPPPPPPSNRPVSKRNGYKKRRGSPTSSGSDNSAPAPAEAQEDFTAELANIH